MLQVVMRSRLLPVLGIVISIVVVFISFVMLEQASTNTKVKESDALAKQQQLINDAYILGASVYRAQALLLVEDSITTRMDTLFIWETKDINDTLAIEASQNFDL